MKFGIVSGGAGLLGRHHCIALAKMGVVPIILDLDKEKALELVNYIKATFSIDARFFAIDVSNENEILKCKDGLSDVLNCLSVLINNAALNPKMEDGGKNLTRLENYSLETWNKEISVGLSSAFLLSKHFGPILANNPDCGKIINVSSDLGIIAPDQRLYHREGLLDKEQFVKPVSYSVIKHGIIGLTKYLATYWPGEVTSNAICPGGIENGQPKDFIVKLQNKIPLGRMAMKDEYEGAIKFLASEASNYMNGQTLVLDGGRSIW